MGNAFQSILGRGVDSAPEPVGMQEQAPVDTMEAPQESPMFSQKANPLPDHSPAWENLKAQGFDYKEGDPKPDENIFRNWNAGIISTLGLTSDILKEAVNLSPAGMPFKLAGTELIDNKFGETGQELQASAAEYGIAPFPGQEGKSLGATIARIGGETVVPYAGFASRGAALTKQGVKAGTNLIDKTALHYAQQPLTATGAEAAGVTGAGVGSDFIRKSYDEADPWAQALAEITGGFVGTGMFYARAVPTIMAKKAFGYFFPSKSRGKELATERVVSLADDLPEDVRRLEGYDTPKGLKMSPAARTRDRELLALENAVFAEEKALRGETQLMHKRELDNLRKLTQIAGDDVADIVEEGATLRDTTLFLNERNKHINNLVDIRLQFANDQLERELGKMAGKDGLMPRESMKAASRKSKEIVMRALDDIRKQEDELWNAVPKNVAGRIDNTDKVYKGIINDWSVKSQADFDLDPVVQKLFGTKDAKGNIIKGSMFQDGGAATAKEIQQSRSAVQQAWRNESGAVAPDANKLRKYNELSEALLQDLKDVTGGDPRYTEAMRFSRDLNQKFRTGTMGRILGRESSSAERIPSEDTLREVVTGRGVTRDIDQMLLATKDKAKPEIENYLYASFFDQVTENKRLNPKAYETWIEKNAPILARFPEVKEQISNAKRAARLVNKYEATQTKVRGELETNKGRVGLFLNAPQDKEVASIFEKSHRPVSTMKYLAAHTRPDPRATAGLKHAVGEYILEVSSKDKVSLAGGGGMYVPDGTKMRHWMEQPRNKDALAELYTPKEIENLHKIANAYEGLKSSLSKGENEMVPITTNAPSLVVDALVRMQALHIGSAAAKGMGPGELFVAGKASSIGGKVAKLLQQPNARRAIIAAVGDEKVMKDLMTSMQKPEEVNKALGRLHAWLVTQLGSTPEEEKGLDARPDRLR